MGTFASPNDATFGVSGLASGQAVTPGAGFTELHEQSSATTMTIESEWRPDNGSPVSATFGTSIQWAIFGVEIAQG
jgi:hypothetical protein